MKPLSLFCIPTFLFFSAAAQAAAEPGRDGAWEMISDKKGLKVFRREVENSRILAFRGEGIIDASPTRILSILLDNARAPEWVASLKEARVIRKISDFEHIEYNLVATPPLIMKNRDFVSRVTLEVSPENSRFTLRFKSHVEPSAPEIKKYVRGDLNKSVFTMTAVEDGSKTFFEAEIHADPKGRVPRWLVNWFQKSWPKTTFRRLRKQLAKPDVHENPWVKGLLPAN